MPYPVHEADSKAWLSRPQVVRALPFLVYAVFLGFQSALDQGGAIPAPGIDTRWLYALRVGATGAVLAYCWNDYAELSFGMRRYRPFDRPTAGYLWAVLVGVLVFVLWINLDHGWVTLGSPGPGFVALDRNGFRDWPLIVVRIFGAAAVVPLMEELFWRSFLQRWIDRPEFLDADPRLTSHRAVLIASLLFGFEHGQWFAGVLAGLAYGYLYKYSGRLWLAVLAHGVTNFMLGCWVVATGQWQFW